MTKGRLGHRGEMGAQHSCAPTRAAESNMSGYACGPSAVLFDNLLTEI